MDIALRQILSFWPERRVEHHLGLRDFRPPRDPSAFFGVYPSTFLDIWTLLAHKYL